MAYNEEKLTRMGSLKQLAQRINADFATKESVAQLEERVEGLATTGGEPNKIEAIKNNGTALEITDKAVDIGASIAEAVAAADHLTRKKVTAVADIDPAAEDAGKFIYMVPKEDAGEDDVYDEYMVLDGKVERVGSTAVKMDIASDDEVEAMLTEVFGSAADAE